MNISNQDRFGKIISIFTLIIAIIGLLLSLAGGYLLTPYLTYEKASYPLPGGESLYVVIVRNEGHKNADAVNIYINTPGQIENVMGQRGLINRESEECQFFEEYVSLTSNKSRFRANFSYLPCEMVYTLYLIVDEHKNDKTPEYILITHRNGIAVERRQSCFIPFAIGLGLGVCSIGVFILLYSLKKKSKKHL